MMQFLTKDLTAAFMPQQGAPKWMTAKFNRTLGITSSTVRGRFLLKLKYVSKFLLIT